MPPRKNTPIVRPVSSGTTRAERAQARQSTKDRLSEEIEYQPPKVARQTSSKSSLTENKDEKLIVNTINRLKAQNKALEDDGHAVENFIRTASKNDPQYLEIQAVEAEEATLRAEITELDESNENLKELLAEYRNRNFPMCTSIRAHGGRINKLAKRFSSSGKADLRREQETLREMTKETAANLHILKHLPVLAAQKKHDEEAVGPTINGMEFMDVEILRGLEDGFQKLQVEVFGAL
ncbi:hypothetical protein RvY_03646 [Ramazzottius varieornatus]|uniref:Uncharacterized protein n=1 Tax=Ramazzottius varieornatus TaxID=947166 RepID=A0A1D1UY71_RAMVA|nr:hypothetical protein RvY_03646 [Ramazzottius varieornatus]